MTILSLIAAIDENRGLGKENKLLCHLPADLKHFRNLTLGKPVIMGRKTHLSIGQALPGRLNIVLSKHVAEMANVTVVASLQQAIALTTDQPEVMIIGGANVFEQALPLAHRIYLTLIHNTFDADTFFPELDKDIWKCEETIDRKRDDKNSYDLTFYRYERYT